MYTNIKKDSTDFYNNGYINVYINVFCIIAQKKYPRYVINQLRNPSSEDFSLELIEALVRHICSTKGPGAILIFLPGMMDIVKLNRMMLDSRRYPSCELLIS